MTEEEWLNAQIAAPLLHFIAPRVSNRKLYYFDIACARRITPLLPFDASRHAVEVMERYVEGQCDDEVFSKLSWDVEGAALNAEGDRIPWIEALEQLPRELLDELAAAPDCPSRNVRELVRTAAFFIDAMFSPEPQERRFRRSVSPIVGWYFQPVSLVHEIFGNPFRTVKFRKVWRTDTVLTLARGMYDSRDFSAMPILADALQDAGCEDDAILSHCRNAQQTHVRGCWVVDLVLGKK